MVPVTSTDEKITVLAAPNSMKGSLDAITFADCIARAFCEVSDRFDVRKIPVADGGDFTGEVLIAALGMQKRAVMVNDPLGRKIEACYGIKGDTAVIEMAGASGLIHLNRMELNPLKTTSYGTGELLADAVKAGAKTIFIGVGGSATVDGGMGLLEALGVRFFDEHGTFLCGNGENSGYIASIDTSGMKLPADLNIRVICDVDNPLLGMHGAARVFGPQKGADEGTVELLEENLTHLAGLVEKITGRKLRNLAGLGSAGGVNLALVGFLNATLENGADFVLDRVGFDKQLRQALLVITGEGFIDRQTLNRKAPCVVAQRARMMHVPVIAIAGDLSPGAEHIFDSVYTLVDRVSSAERAIEQAGQLVFDVAKEIAVQFLDDLFRPDHESLIRD